MASLLAQLNEEIIGCRRCDRLRNHCETVARAKRRAYMQWDYWGKPVPSFGDEQARVLILGLAPGAHGSNRTGRPFTGDGSGDFLYPILYETGFASQPTAVSREDGLRLQDCWITSVARCAPPDNKPARAELANCVPYLDREFTLLHRLRVIVCLGRIAFDGCLQHFIRTGELGSKAGFVFSHGAEYRLTCGRVIIASFHPSLQNTNTGRLTRPMLRQIFERARSLAANAQAPHPG